MASKKKKRKRRRRRNKGRFSFLLKLLAIAAVFTAMTMGATVFFQMEQVEVTGNCRYTPQEIERVSGLSQGDNLFRINKYEIKEEILRALPYVEDVVITRRLPSTIQISVQEWDAVALIPASGYLSGDSKDEDNREPGKETESMEVPEPESERKDEEPEEIPQADESKELTEVTEEETRISEEEKNEENSARDTADTNTSENLWLMSSGGRILERASTDSPGILIKGLYALAPKAGTQLAVSQEQQEKLNSLLELMAALDERGSMERVSTINLSFVSEIYMYYDDRFLIKLPMAGDFDYCLYALEKVIEQRADNERGIMDLTRKDYAVVYSPE